jgi:elongator complex protein 3
MSQSLDTTTLQKYLPQLRSMLEEFSKTERVDTAVYRSIVNKYPRDGKFIYAKHYLVAAYRHLLHQGDDLVLNHPDLLSKIQMKPMRTQSGVTPVTVLTKPYPCPGQCIFCPSDVRMPKSYMSDEPGAQRAERNKFDPYLQTYRRIQALHEIGHSVDKIEIIILGGTWSFYPESYQIWFIKRIFDALNEFGVVPDQTSELEKSIPEYFIPPHFGKNFLSKVQNPDTFKQIPDYKVNHLENDKTWIEGVKAENDWLQNAEAITRLAKSPYNQVVTKIIKNTRGQLHEEYEKANWQELEQAHKINETALCRSVGLVIETRPDHISPEEVLRIRRLGCTKVQIGFQSTDDEVLKLNQRGHDNLATITAIKLLRLGGFKIHGHWMANLYGSNPELDITGYKKMFNDDGYKPDELKIYPCSLIETAELVHYFEAGKWQPYNQEELTRVVAEAIGSTPEYCRLTRIIRDIPSTDIMVGNKLTNFREFAEKYMDDKGIIKSDIRSREVKHLQVKRSELTLDRLEYKTTIGTEIFLQFITKDRQIAGFLRLSLPNVDDLKTKVKPFTHPFSDELDHSSMIREVHIYGKTVDIGDKESGKAQHVGLGTELISEAVKISKELGYKQINVISAIGTRGYYRKKGFSDGSLYQFIKL